MHFSIPDTEDIKDENKQMYKAFNVHINGVLHCVVRYSQLHDLNEKLKLQFGPRSVPSFPPKKFLQVKGTDLEERKFKLEKYIQELSQDAKLSTSETFVTFLCRAQQETQREESIPISFEVYLLNELRLAIDIHSTDKTDDVLENVMHTVGISSELTHYFGLFLVKKEQNDSFSLVRKLQEFECPYISLKCLHARRAYRVVLRKAYWDQSYDEVIAADPIGLKLLTAQAESDISVGWTICSDEIKARLLNLKTRGSKNEYLQLCQTLPQYGYLQFNTCLSDHPKATSTVRVMAGNYELKVRYLVDEVVVNEECFSVTRMKCWNLSSSFKGQGKRCKELSDQPLLQLGFEYLFPDDRLMWISFVSNQAIIMSMCIKSMVDELMRKRRGENIRKPIERSESTTFKPRDKSTKGLFHPSALPVSDYESVGAIQKAKESVKKLTEKLSTVSILSKPPENTEDSSNPNSQTHYVSSSSTNETSFEAIGDDDL